MMKCIVTYHDAAQKAINESSGDTKITWAIVFSHTKDTFKKLTDMKFEMPRQTEAHYKKVFNVQFHEEIMSAFRQLVEDRR